MITQERLKELLRYDPETGHFTVLVKRVSLAVGTVLGGQYSEYHQLRIEGIDYKAHRLAFLYMAASTPDQVDHINGDISDNRWCNLRAVTVNQNQWNRRANKKSRTGFKGVAPQGSKFGAKITKNKKVYCLGTFDTAEEAHQAYCDKADELHGIFANHG